MQLTIIIQPGKKWMTEGEKKKKKSKRRKLREGMRRKEERWRNYHQVIFCSFPTLVLFSLTFFSTSILYLFKNLNNIFNFSFIFIPSLTSFLSSFLPLSLPPSPSLSPFTPKERCSIVFEEEPAFYSIIQQQQKHSLVALFQPAADDCSTIPRFHNPSKQGSNFCPIVHHCSMPFPWRFFLSIVWSWFHVDEPRSTCPTHTLSHITSEVNSLVWY